MAKKTYIKGVTFQFEPDKDSPLGPHISYTTKAVGGAASGLNNPILLKAENVKVTKGSLELMKAAKEVRIEMSMEMFLQKFMHLYCDDAAILAKILGYESSLDEAKETYQDHINEKLNSFKVLKSLKTEDDFFALDYKDQIEVLKTQEAFEAGLVKNEKELEESFLNKAVQKMASEKLDENSEYFKRLSADHQKEVLARLQKQGTVIKSQNESKEDVTKNGEKTKMSDTDKTALEAVQKAEKLAADLQKAQETIAALQAAEDKRVEQLYVTKAQSYVFVGDKAAPLAKVLKGLKDEDALLVLEVLNAAKASLDKANEPMFNRQSIQGESQDSETLTKSREATKAALSRELGKDKETK